MATPPSAPAYSPPEHPDASVPPVPPAAVRTTSDPVFLSASDPWNQVWFTHKVETPNAAVAVFGLRAQEEYPDMVLRYMSQYGTILGSQFLRNPANGKLRGFGFVHFERLRDARRCVEDADGVGIVVGNVRVRLDYRRQYWPGQGSSANEPVVERRRDRSRDRSPRERRRRDRSRERPRVVYVRQPPQVVYVTAPQQQQPYMVRQPYVVQQPYSVAYDPSSAVYDPALARYDP